MQKCKYLRAESPLKVVLQTTVRILQYKPHGVVVVHATKLKVAKHTLN